MCDQVRSAALLIDLKKEVAEKLLRAAVCAAHIELDVSQGRWKYAQQTPLGYKLEFEIPPSSSSGSGEFISLDVVFTQAKNGTIVLANYTAAPNVNGSLINEIYLKTQTVIETTMPLIVENQ